jgi:signal peptidase I
MWRKHDIMIRSMNPNQPNNPDQPPQARGNTVPVSDIYPANPAAPAQASSYLPVDRLQKAPGDSQPNSPKPKRDYSGLRSIISTVLLLAIAPLIAFGITSYIIQSYQVDGESMETTLQNNDRLIVDKAPRTISRLTGHSYIPHRGDIIIFNQANLPDTSFGQSKQLIKRVIALPGEHIVVSDGRITIYNDSHPGGFNPDTSTGYKITAPSTTGEVDVTLGKDQLFVCGDNRPNSEDSRYFGPINADALVGKLSLRLLPVNKAQKF